MKQVNPTKEGLQKRIVREHSRTDQFPGSVFKEERLEEKGGDIESPGRNINVGVGK